MIGAAHLEVVGRLFLCYSSGKNVSIDDMKTQYPFAARFVLVITSLLMATSSACVASTREPTLTTPPDTPTATFIPTTSTTVPTVMSVVKPGVRTDQKPEGGIILTMVINPESPTTLYVGTYGGGVFKSTDSGEEWWSTVE
jgi:hypothetical protein